MNYRISRSAERDLADILDYISADSPKAADRLEEDFFEAFELLGTAPGAGHRRPDLTDLPLRFFTVRRHIIAYYAEASPIEIVRIVSGVRDLPKLFE